ADPAAPAAPAAPADPASPAGAAPGAAPGSGQEPPAPSDGRSMLPKARRRDLVAVAGVALVVVLATMWTTLWPAAQAAGPGDDLRVLVLPLTPSDSADEPFADGLSESIMDALALVDGVRVPSWSAAMALRGVNAPEAARKTGVDYVVEGSVRRDADDSLRIVVRLVGSDGDAVWGDKYDRSAREMRKTWDEIARAVLTTLEVRLGGAELAGASGETDDATARDRFEKGRHAWLKRTPGGLQQAVGYYHQAVQRDPSYARAHAALADAYNLMGDYLYGVLPPDSAFPMARRSAERALEIAPGLGEAHAALASVLYQYDRDFDAADRAYRRAIELKPHYAEANHWYSLFLLASGREEEATAAVRRAIELDSLSPVMRTSLARHHYFRGDPATALREYQRALRLEPGFITAHLGAGVTLLDLGRHDEAIAAFQRVDDLVDGPHPLSMALTANAHGRAGRPEEARAILRQLEAVRATGRWIPPEWFGLVHIGLGDDDAAIAAFEGALERGSSSGPFLGIEPLSRPLTDDPRFQQLIERGRQPARR
ncbi:MAG: tetratricopeptide repeat protein, partial [Gemmatimonadetes bacterium]|nr:tetratricopeptide repeat protein [Gemmatimonadota bacterium]